MPFDAPYQTPFGDIELLKDARSRISNRRSWVQRRFQDGGPPLSHSCAVIGMWEPQLPYAKPHRTAACSADRQADTARCAIHDKVQAHTCQTAPYVAQ